MESPSMETNSTAGHPADGLTIDSLFSNPPEISSMRNRLFDPVTPFRLSRSEFDIYFPYVDNVYTAARPTDSSQEKITITEYPCRIRQSQQSQKAEKRRTRESTGIPPTPRAKRQKIEETCPMVLKVTTTVEGSESQCTVERADPDVGHIHDLDRSDGMKRNSVVMNIARREGEKGYTTSSIYEKMCQERERMNDAGGKFMKFSDVGNACMKWRQANPDVSLKDYEGTVHKRQRRHSQTSDSKQPHFPHDTLRYPASAQIFLDEYLPRQRQRASQFPFITLTYATSLDARLAIMPNMQTALSGPESKAMTHYLRSKHDGILIGVGTALADNPGLNCRIEGVGGYGRKGLAGQPRPIIIDPHGRFPVHPDLKVLRLARNGQGRGPWIIVAEGTIVSEERRRILKDHDGAYIEVRWQATNTPSGKFISWFDVFSLLAKEGLKSVMVEGGAVVLSELLQHRYRDIISSVIITIAPTFLGHAGPMVAPNMFQPTGQDLNGRTTFTPVPSRLRDVRCQALGTDDVILCGKLGPEPKQMANGSGAVADGISDGNAELAHGQSGHGSSG